MSHRQDEVDDVYEDDSTPRRRREVWIGDDVVRCLLPNHVHELLTFICGFWSNYWNVPWVPIPDPLPPPVVPRGSSKQDLPDGVTREQWIDQVREIRSSTLAARAEALSSPETKRSIRLSMGDNWEEFLPSQEPDTTIRERALWCAVIHRAISDFSYGICSPLPKDQRMALDAYWWIMGLGWINPPSLRMTIFARPGDPAPDLNKPLRGRARLDESDNVFDALPCSVVRLVNAYHRGPVYYPGAEEAGVVIDEASEFVNICDSLGFDYAGIRNRLYLISPTA